jgi:hypothetical protein
MARRAISTIFINGGGVRGPFLEKVLSRFASRPGQGPRPVSFLSAAVTD